jgi:2-oxo-4-hydroxy-4-carboxy-5-ureidoimidazoline decarboxylase
VNAILEAWNHQDTGAAANAVLPCCGSHSWANQLVAGRPYRNEHAVFDKSDAVWSSLSAKEWGAAFSSHPRIGDREAPASATAASASWSGQEQEAVTDADESLQEQLRSGNEAYEQRFGRTYIVCATGKSAEEMLAILQQRLGNDDEEELLEAVEQQRQITQLRLRKWLQA